MTILSVEIKAVVMYQYCNNSDTMNIIIVSLLCTAKLTYYFQIKTKNKNNLQSKVEIKKP